MLPVAGHRSLTMGANESMSSQQRLQRPHRELPRQDPTVGTLGHYPHLWATNNLEAVSSFHILLCVVPWMFLWE